MARNTIEPVLISVVVPVFNEAQGLKELYVRLKHSVIQIAAEYEFIFVNDGSRDHSLSEILRLANLDSKVLYLDLSRNFGHQVAVSAGLDVCRGGAVVIIDGDLQDPPELIPKLYAKYKEGFEVVYAKRSARKGEGLLKKASAKMFYQLLKRITSVDIPVDTGDFRLMDAKVVAYLRQMPERNKFLRGQIAWLGFRQTYVLFERDERKFGTTGYSFGKMMTFALDGITGFSEKPLQLVTRLGIGISTISFLVILYAIYSHFFLHQTVTGWTSLIISSMFIGGVQLFSIGIIGEYVGRINQNVLKRPLYIVSESNFPPSNAG